MSFKVCEMLKKIQNSSQKNKINKRGTRNSGKVSLCERNTGHISNKSKTFKINEKLRKLNSGGEGIYCFYDVQYLRLCVDTWQLMKKKHISSSCRRDHIMF